MRNSIGTYAIAKICDVSPSTVGQWIEQGKLPAFITAGGRHRVWFKDLVVFLTFLNIPIPPELQNIDQKPQVLIVDDDSITRALIRRVLLKLLPDAEVHDASDGFEAGQKTATFNPFLIILDLVLPDMNGIDVCSGVRKNPSLKTVKILAISGAATDKLRKSALSAGADDFISKPFGAAEITAALKHLLELRPSRRIKQTARGENA